MSLKNKDKVFTVKITDQMVAVQVANALRAEQSESTAAMKNISNLTGINLPTISKWYNGINAPKSSHLLTLARIYPAVLRILLEMIGREDLWALCKEYSIPEKMNKAANRIPPKIDIYSAKSVTINVMLNSQMAGQFNPRQLWFLLQLQQESRVTCNDIVSIWKVTLRTARRDIAGLEEAGMVAFVGAKKTGYYVCK